MRCDAKFHSRCRAFRKRKASRVNHRHVRRVYEPCSKMPDVFTSLLPPSRGESRWLARVETHRWASRRSHQQGCKLENGTGSLTLCAGKLPISHGTTDGRARVEINCCTIRAGQQEMWFAEAWVAGCVYAPLSDAKLQCDSLVIAGARGPVSRTLWLWDDLL